MKNVTFIFSLGGHFETALPPTGNTASHRPAMCLLSIELFAVHPRMEQGCCTSGGDDSNLSDPGQQSGLSIDKK